MLGTSGDRQPRSLSHCSGHRLLAMSRADARPARLAPRDHIVLPLVCFSGLLMSGSPAIPIWYASLAAIRSTSSRRSPS